MQLHLPAFHCRSCEMREHCTLELHLNWVGIELKLTCLKEIYVFELYMLSLCTKYICSKLQI